MNAALYRTFIRGSWEREGLDLQGGPSCLAFSSLGQHAAENGLMCASLWAFNWCAGPLPVIRARLATYRPGLAARLAQLSLAITFAGIAHPRAASGQLMFMLQPCHVGLLFLMRLLSVGGGSKGVGLWIGMLSLCNAWGYLIAFFAPDPELASAGKAERFFFNAEHLLLLGCNQYLTLRCGFIRSLVSEWRWRLRIGCIGCLYHSLLLTPADLLTGVNVNYMLCPPPILTDNLDGALADRYRLVAAFVGFCASQLWLWVMSAIADGVARAGGDDGGGPRGTRKAH